MKDLPTRLSSQARKPDFPLILILIANLIAGLLTFRDFGLSWDEPLFYQYAQAVPYAYSISARLSGDFDIQKSYGPSAEDHKIYGPIYLLLAKPAVDLLDWMLPVPRADLWHLVNFLTFQIGVVFFFLLCKRWMSSWAAFGATLLFSTQPVLYGHAWINPKDIPFTVFFLAALYFGFEMVDALSDPAIDPGVVVSTDEKNSDRRWRRGRIILQVLAASLLGITLVLYVFSNQVQGLLSSLTLQAYHAAPASLLGRIFGSLAAHAQTVSADAYIAKGLVLLRRFRIALLVFAILAGVPAFVLTFWTRLVRQMIDRLSATLAPLPSRPAWWWRRLKSWQVLFTTMLAGILLGLVISIRIIGPLAGVLVILYFLFNPGRHSVAGIIVYILAALLALYCSWPFLWSAPLANFVEVVRHMSHNPQILPVLFNGVVYPSDHLPRSYLPVMLAITLTWPVLPLFMAGLAVMVLRIKSGKSDWRSLTPILVWFLVPLIYILAVRPPMYDGYRHFLFLLPPVFILGGLVIQSLSEILRDKWFYALTLAVLVVPGVIGLVQMHPYEYSYYNLFVGGVKGAFRHYETDFWLTCYKQLMAQVDARVTPGTTIFVYRQPSIAQEYASPGLTIERYDPDADRTFPGSLLLLTTRANVDLIQHPEAPVLLSTGKEGATFCLVKAIP